MKQFWSIRMFRKRFTKMTISQKLRVGLSVKKSVIYSPRSDLIFTTFNYEPIWIEFSTGVNNM